MRFVFITISLWLSSSGIGQVSGWKEAKEALDSKKYQEAINLFKKIESNDGGGAGLYQNMALAAVGMQMYGDAVLYYEKALKYHPNDQQIKNDIKIIYERKNLLPPPGSSLFTTLPGLLMPHSWAWMGLVLLAIACYNFWRKYPSLSWSRTEKVGIVLPIMLFVLSTVAGGLRYRYLYQNNGIIITSPSTALKMGPDEVSPDLTDLPEGTKVFFKEHLGDWWHVTTSYGDEGWIPAGHGKKI